MHRNSFAKSEEHNTNAERIRCNSWKGVCGGGGMNELIIQLGGSESFGTCDTNRTVFFSAAH